MIGIIPCRYQSSRFPGKPLADIGDKPMMWHVYQQALKAKSLEDVYIATDDYRISDACAHFEMNVIMTRVDHVSGTDRIAECSEKLDSDSFVNIQGDEPFISPESIDRVALALKESGEGINVTNAYSVIENPSDVHNPNVVKVVLSSVNQAVFYSRSPIPYGLRNSPKYLRQLGLYAFTKDALGTFAKRRPGYLEECEAVEMLRFVEHGDAVLMVEVESDGMAVDTPEDLVEANKFFSASKHQAKP